MARAPVKTRRLTHNATEPLPLLDLQLLTPNFIVHEPSKAGYSVNLIVDQAEHDLQIVLGQTPLVGPHILANGLRIGGPADTIDDLAGCVMKLDPQRQPSRVPVAVHISGSVEAKSGKHRPIAFKIMALQGFVLPCVRCSNPRCPAWPLAQVHKCFRLKTGQVRLD